LNTNNHRPTDPVITLDGVGVKANKKKVDYCVSFSLSSEIQNMPKWLHTAHHMFDSRRFLLFFLVFH